MKKLNKIILGTTPLIYLYAMFAIVYVGMGVKLTNLLGNAIDVSNKSRSEFKSFAILPTRNGGKPPFLGFDKEIYFKT